MKFIDEDELDHIAPVEFLVGTHFVTRGLNILFGPSGAYKSFYMLDKALLMAQAGPVIYVAAEGVSGLSKRVKAWRQYHKKAKSQLYFILHEIDLLREMNTLAFIASIKQDARFKDLLMIVFDTYARCIPGGDENSAKDIGLVIQNCAKIQRALGCGLSLVHHTNRAERGERGSGALRGAADAMIEIGNADGLIRVDCSKEKDGEAWVTEFYRFFPVNESGVLRPADELDDPIKLTAIQLKVLDFLTLEVFQTCGAQGRQIAAGLNLTEATLYRTLSKLKKNSHVHQDKKGDPYSITDLGLAALSTQLAKKKANGKAKDDKDLDDELSDSQATIN